jgi:hypothetical protein
MAQQERMLRQDALADQLLQRARGYDEDAEVVRRLLRDHMAATATSEDEQDVS